MDRRPQNVLEVQLPTPTPHGTQLGLIIFEPHEGFCITVRDLSNFFCSLGMDGEKVRRNVVRRCPLASEGIHGGGSPSALTA